MPEFLDRLKKGLDRGVTTVAVRSKELVELTQLRGRLGRLKEEQQHAFEDLGSIVYTLVSQDRLDADRDRVRTKCAAAAEIVAQIRATEEEIERVQTEANRAVGASAAAVQCSCGAAMREGAKFCARCGQPLTSSSPSSGPTGA